MGCCSADDQMCLLVLQIFEEDSDESMNDSYWTYRAEAIPEEELNLKEGEQVLFLCHVSMKEDKRVRLLTALYYMPHPRKASTCCCFVLLAHAVLIGTLTILKRACAPKQTGLLCHLFLHRQEGLVSSWLSLAAMISFHV